MIYLTPAPLLQNFMSPTQYNHELLDQAPATLPRIGAGYSPARRPDICSAKVGRGVSVCNARGLANKR